MRLSAFILLSVLFLPVSTTAELPDTYADTLHGLKAWVNDGDDKQVARLFSLGRSRASEMLEACRTQEDDVAAAAGLALQLRGDAEFRECCRTLVRRHGAPAMACASGLVGVDFEEVERGTLRLDCDTDERGIPDSLVYALILDGSPRAEALLSKLREFIVRCNLNGTVLGETLADYESLLSDLNSNGQGLDLSRRTVEEAVRGTAFFIPRDYREHSDVKVLAENSDKNRILLEVSYHCGLLCGKGYYVVLEKKESSWRYAVITMTWIS